MHDLDPAQPRPAQRPFVPRLVGGDGEPARSPAPTAARAAGAQQVELHDPTVREIADSLTDLFLGTKPGEQGKQGGRGPAPAPSQVTAGSGMTSNPRPTRFFGQSGLKHGQSSNGSGAARRPLVPVELLVLGHLPVLANAWPTQYASQAAAGLGKPIALARLEPGGLSIDLFGVPKDVPVSRQGSVVEAMSLAAALAAAWLIRVDELAEASIAESPRLGSVTVLSGVSESSVVAAYRTLKAIAQRGAARADGETAQRELAAELRIALLGASPERAAEASARVRRAAATFLGRPVGVVVCPEKIGMTGMQALFRGPFEGGALGMLGLIDSPPAACAPAPGIPGDGACSDASAPVEPERSEVHADPDLGEADWLLDPEAVPPPRAAIARPATGESAPKATESVERIEPAATFVEPPPPAAATAPEPVATPPVSSVDGKSLAPLLRLSPLPVRCPDAPGVELAADNAGGLHAIVADETCAVTEGSAPGPAGVAALLIADGWFRANRDLLGRALPFLTQGEVALHVVTRAPAAARGLLGTRCHVHLLARAAAPGDMCIDLN